MTTNQVGVHNVHQALMVLNFLFIANPNARVITNMMISINVFKIALQMEIHTTSI